MTRLTSDDLKALLLDALEGLGFSPANALALASQTVLAEELGQSSVGFSHLFDYIDGLKAGRIDGHAVPLLSEPKPTIIAVDGQSGLPQSGFDLAFEALLGKARNLGMAVFLQRNTTLCGSLGTFVLRLAERGLVGLAATNGSPLLAGSGSREAVYCTNPIAFAVPQLDGPPLLIDQASSATAYLNIRIAAEKGEEIPEGLALDSDGEPTRDPQAALAGTMLPFGGARGGNMALMVEFLAAGLTGANWSLDAPSFFEGDRTPGAGLFVLAIDPGGAAPDFTTRMAGQIRRLAEDYAVHVPGTAKQEVRHRSALHGLEIDQAMIDRLQVMTGIRR